ncbi:hypothetical protein H0H81_011927, partial [Sphagnurus paluster]
MLVTLPDPPGSPPRVGYLVVLKEGVSYHAVRAQVGPGLSAAPSEASEYLNNTKLFSCDLTPEALEALRSNPGVQSVGKNHGGWLAFKGTI